MWQEERRREEKEKGGRWAPLQNHLGDFQKQYIQKQWIRTLDQLNQNLRLASLNFKNTFKQEYNNY